MKTVLLYLKAILTQLARLNNPATDVALAAIVVKLLPFVHVSTTTLVGVAAAVGLVATWAQRALAGVPATVAAKKAAVKKASQS